MKNNGKIKIGGIMKNGFNNKKYVKIQSQEIRKRIKLFDKLYLEVGGKLFDDYHAARVLPGFKPDSKINMFKELKNDMEIIFCINANDIERNKTRAEYGITYDIEVLRLIDNLQKQKFKINSVVITLYNNQASVDKFLKKLERNNIKTYIHMFTKGYPTDVNTIVSEEGYGANPYIETTKPLVLVNAPGPGSGKLATCLSQLYHEHKRGVNAGYAKFETFPVWNLPLKHPVNIAYEAATADLKDVNMIDPFHLQEYGKTAINYNRDIELFPVLKTILNKITGDSIYKSPTDMGVNMIGSCIENNEVVEIAAKKEIVRRYFNEMSSFKIGQVDADVPRRIKVLMNEINIDETYLDVVKPAIAKSKIENKHVVSIKLPSKKIITGKESELLSSTSATILNAIKEIAHIPDKIKLLPANLLEAIMKNRPNGTTAPLKLSELLVALSICSVTNPTVEKALSCLKKLDGCDSHSTFILPNDEIKALKSLKLNVTCEPCFYNEDTFIY